MLIIAHRGASFDAPENTLAAVRLAWQQQADAVEVDAHLSRDGKLVVIHDDNTRKTTGVNRKVANQTLAELRALDAGSWKGPAWLGEKIPTLDEVLATVPRRKHLFIEIKARANAAPELAKAFTQSQCRPEQMVLIGFSFATMKALKRVFPQVEVCWITVLKRHRLTRRWPDPQKLIQKVKAVGLDGLDLNANAGVTRSLVKKIHSAGLKLYVWTVDSPALAKKMAHAGVDGITTNRPGFLRLQFGVQPLGCPRLKTR